MREHSHAEDLDVPRAHVQVPKEVSQCKALQQSGHAIIAPDSLLPVVGIAPSLALLIEEDHVQAESVDEATLHERDDVHIPADPGAAVELPVSLRAETVGDERRDDVGDEGVETKSEENLVGVQRKGGQSAQVGDVLEGRSHGDGRLNWVGIEHGAGLPDGDGRQRRGGGMVWAGARWHL